MVPLTLFERLGGAVGVDAIVGALYAWAEGDPLLSARVSSAARDRICAYDVALLAGALGGPGRDASGWAKKAPAGDGGGSLLSGSDPAVRWALRDVLWLLGVSSALVDEVLAAVDGAASITRPAT